MIQTQRLGTWVLTLGICMSCIEWQLELSQVMWGKSAKLKKKKLFQISPTYSPPEMKHWLFQIWTLYLFDLKFRRRATSTWLPWDHRRRYYKRSKVWRWVQFTSFLFNPFLMNIFWEQLLKTSGKLLPGIGNHFSAEIQLSPRFPPPL